MQDVWAIDGKETEAIRVESPILPFKTFGRTISSESLEEARMNIICIGCYCCFQQNINETEMNLNKN